MMSKIRLITLVIAVFVILCPVLTQAADSILTEDFEDNALDSRIHVETIGDVTNPSPGIKDITEFGSQKAFGFGRSTCGADCWDGFVTKLIIQFPSPTYVSYLSFKEIELFGNWGSEGYIFVDGIGLQEYCGPYSQNFGRCPVNDWQTDTTFRTKSVLLNKVVETIELRSWDITNVSEIFIDDLKVFDHPVSTICQVAHNGDYDPDPGSLNNLVTEIINRTGENEVFNGGVVTLDSVPSCSMLYITGHYPFSFTEAERTNLRTYLQNGGAIFADDCSNYLDGEGFESSFRAEIQTVLGQDLEVLPSDHAVFSSFYTLSGTLPTAWNNEPLEGINVSERTAVIYSDNDYGCAWEGAHGECDSTCRENSFEMGTNIALYKLKYDIKYALTVDRSDLRGGVIQSSDGGINCGADCQESYAYGSSILLVAIPNDGWKLEYWDDGTNKYFGDLSITISMNEDKTITAKFIPKDILNVPLYSQNDQQWACNQLGDCTDCSMGCCPTGCCPRSECSDGRKPNGCAVTSLSMIYNYYSPGFKNPGELNQYLKDNDGYAYCGGKCCVKFPDKKDTSPIGAPDGVFYDGFLTGLTKKVRDKIDLSLVSGNPVLARVKCSGVPMHFVVIVGKINNTYWINDPWDGKWHTLNNGALCRGGYTVDIVRFYYFGP